MRGVKPFKLSFLTRPFQFRRQCRLGVAVLGYFDFATGSLSTDMEMWSDMAELLGTEMALDTGVPKSRAEFLVVGSAHQPGGVPGPVRRVRAAVGGVEKVLYVVGDREWRRGVPTEPTPFVSMPLTWERAFGGEGYEPNPRGRGFEPVEREDGEEHHALPNVELPGDIIDAIGDRPPPASFGVVDFLWPQRMSLAGTYDAAWLETDYPGFARDIDWRLWNMASQDQQREAPFEPGEPFVLEHLHPKKPKIEGRLPELVARCFVQLLEPLPDDAADDAVPETRMEEVALRLTTVWLFPELEKGLLVWHGAQECRHDDGADVDVLMVAAEATDAPRSVAHYADVMARRTGPDRAVEVLNDDDLVPSGQAGMGGEIDEHMALLTPKNLAAKRRRAEADERLVERRALIASYGLDPDEHGPRDLPPDVEVPPLEKIFELQKLAMAEVERLKVIGETHRAEARARGKAFYEEVGLDFSEVEREISAPARRGPPEFTADGERANMRKLAEQAKASGHEVPELEFYATDEGRYRLWKQAEEQQWEAYRAFAHKQAPAFPLEHEASLEVRARVLAAVERGDSMKGWDLTGADLTGLDLSDADLEAALMESAVLAGVRLRNANLSGAMLAHSNLHGAVLDGANLTGANVGGARLLETSAVGARFVKATLEGATFEKCDLSGALLPGFRVNEGTLIDVTMEGADLSEAFFYKAELRGGSWAGANLARVHFIESTVRGVNLEGANLEDGTLVDLDLAGVNLARAKLFRLRFMKGGSLADAKLVRADLRSANLRGVAMQRADLSGAWLDGAILSEAKLRGARLTGARARHSSWVRADLRDAWAAGGDFFEATFAKADIRGASFRAANLYGADFALVHGDDETDVSDAIKDLVRAKPVRST